MSTISFSGLSSGLDSGSLIDSLVAAERSAATTLQTRQADLTTQKSIVNSLSAALSSFGTAARGMDLSSELQPRTAVSSDTKVTVAASSAAATAVHDIRVKQLARAQVTSSNTFATSGAGVAGTGGLTITQGGTSKAVSWTASDSLDSIASKINNANAGVSASVLFDGSAYRLVTTAKATGTAAAATFVETGDSLGLADPANVKLSARDAIVEIDGISVTRGKNVIEDALTGLTITATGIHADDAAASSVSVSLDKTAVKDKLEAFVKAYNAVNSALHVQLDYTGTKKGSNTLFGDSTLRQLQSSLGQMMSGKYGDTSLAAIGISRDKTGAMTLDATKLDTALAADSGAVEKLMVENQLATKIGDMADQYTRAGTGLFAGKTAGMTARDKTLQTSIDRINRNADQLQTRLEAQFGALEQAISNMKSQSSYLTSMLGY